MSKTLNTIGILGGTFDPIHLGHLQLARELYQRIPLQEIRFIPAYQPVHRNSPKANTNDRLNMLKLALIDQAGFVIDERELQRQGPSFMIDTLISLRKEMPENSLCLLMATDAFAGFDSWHRWQEILNYAHIIVVNRPEIPFTYSAMLQQFILQHKTEQKELLTTKTHGYLYFMNIPALPISATNIRQQIAAGQQPENLLPKKVWEYIEKHNLYGY